MTLGKLVIVLVLLLSDGSRTCLLARIPPWQRSSAASHEAAPLLECAAASGVETEIKRYLQSSLSESTRPGVFHVQGWRWHTMSLVREARRLHQLAHRLQTEPQESDDAAKALYTVADYCVNFNLRGLHRIEKELFFPWLKTKMSSIPDPGAAREFGSILDELERDRQRIESLGVSLVCHCLKGTDSASIYFPVI
jgi:hypothetical protein